MEILPSKARQCLEMMRFVQKYSADTGVCADCNYWSSFRAAYVLEISQTDGNQVPRLKGVNGNSSEYRERLGKLVAEQGIAPEYSEDIAPARGRSAGGKITLLPSQSAAEEFATLSHELAHEMMHRDERRSSTTKRIRETEAEAVAFVVCSAIGLETGSAVQDYIGLYGSLTNPAITHAAAPSSDPLGSLAARESRWRKVQKLQA